MLLTIKSAFRKLSTSRTAKLLVLEFIVVLSGVLAAQVLQGWFAEREEESRAEARLAGITDALHNSAELAIIRRRINVCMLDAIERVRDVLADPNADRSGLEWMESPEQMVLDETGIDSARPLISRHYDPNVMRILSSAQFMNEYMRSGQDEELEAWSRLKLLRPENGPISETTRSELQQALADAERTNRLLYEVSGVMMSRAEQIGTPIHDDTIYNQMGRSPKLCMNQIGFSDEDHTAAAARGELPDGKKLHPRIIARMQES